MHERAFAGGYRPDRRVLHRPSPVMSSARCRAERPIYVLWQLTEVIVPNMPEWMFCALCGAMTGRLMTWWLRSLSCCVRLSGHGVGPARRWCRGTRADGLPRGCRPFRGMLGALSSSSLRLRLADPAPRPGTQLQAGTWRSASQGSSAPLQHSGVTLGHAARTSTTLSVHAWPTIRTGCSPAECSSVNISRSLRSWPP
jgi:hypothetical protein